MSTVHRAQPWKAPPPGSTRHPTGSFCWHLWDPTNSGQAAKACAWSRVSRGTTEGLGGGSREWVGGRHLTLPQRQETAWALRTMQPGERGPQVGHRGPGCGRPGPPGWGPCWGGGEQKGTWLTSGCRQALGEISSLPWAGSLPGATTKDGRAARSRQGCLGRMP